MKPTLLKAVPSTEYSFIVRHDIGKEMENNWHYHPDYELLYIKRSTGTWHIGDYIGHFKSGDVVLLGPNLPHSFRHEHKYILERDKKPGEAIVVLFLKEILGSSFLDLPEAKKIKNIISQAQRGIEIIGNTRTEVAGILDKMLFGSPGKRLINLLLILQTIAEKKEHRLLASSGYTNKYDSIDNAKLSSIFEYTFNNYQNQLSIEEVAAIINMGKYSFCRHFKEKTKKTYIQFLMEVRIGKASRLLIEEDMNVAEVGYACGYNSISHFCHQFKVIKNLSPVEYRLKYQKIAISI